MNNQIFKNVSPAVDSYLVNTSKQVNGNVDVTGNGDGTCKFEVDKRMVISKREAIELLKECRRETPPKYVAELLEIVFSTNPSEPGWWLHIAQKWTPRTINRVLSQIIKQHQRGETSIRNPSAYFSKVIRYRAKRKIKLLIPSDNIQSN